MANDKNNIPPHLVHSHDVQLDADYTQWLVELKARYRSAQIKAAVRVNVEKLLFYWQLGRDLVIKKAGSRWGEGIVEQLSLDLQTEFPNDKGFSARNLWDMKKWYLYYTTADTVEKLRQFAAEMAMPLSEEEKLRQAVVNLNKNFVSLVSLFINSRKTITTNNSSPDSLRLLLETGHKDPTSFQQLDK